MNVQADPGHVICGPALVANPKNSNPDFLMPRLQLGVSWNQKSKRERKLEDWKRRGASISSQLTDVSALLCPEIGEATAVNTNQ